MAICAVISCFQKLACGNFFTFLMSALSLNNLQTFYRSYKKSDNGDFSAEGLWVLKY